MQAGQAVEAFGEITAVLPVDVPGHRAGPTLSTGFRSLTPLTVPSASKPVMPRGWSSIPSGSDRPSPIRSCTMAPRSPMTRSRGAAAITRKTMPQSQKP